jgi:hypothetical protein
VNEALATRAEIVKLARLIGREPDSLSYLESVPADEIRALRDHTTEVLFRANGSTLSRLAAASRLLPVGLVATLGERAFGPVLSARIAGLLEPSRAVEMAEKLPITFLADIAIDIDPRRAKDVIAGIPPRRIAEITRELARRQEYVTMGRFVGQMPDGSVAAGLAELDDAALLRVAFILEAKESLPDLVGLLPEERIDAIIDAAARENLWAEALDLLSRLSSEQRAEFAEQAGKHRQPVFDSLIRCARDFEMWQSLLPLTVHLPREGQKRAANAIRKLRLSADERGRVLAYARDEGLTEQLGPVREALEEKRE